jgi:flagellar basal-body rod modification protein FlgD
MDNAQMTSQLAQISTVDGIEKLNATLQKLVNGSVDSQAMQAAGMVGHQVMVAGNGLTLTDKGAVGGIELGSSADSVVITVKDSSGLVVKTINMGDLDPGIHNFVWDGATDAGGQAVNGNYSLTVAALRSGEKINATTLQLAQVVGVNRSTQGISLDLGALGPAVMSDIKQIF